jgi:hypothetical protein
MIKMHDQTKDIYSFLISQEIIDNGSHQTIGKSGAIFIELYNKIDVAFHFSKNVSVKEIESTKEQPKDFDGIPDVARSYIKNKPLTEYVYQFSLFAREIIIHFFEETPIKKNHVNHIRKIITWLRIINDISSKTCSSILNIYIYLTSLKKELPREGETIGYDNANTGFTRPCLTNSEIIIYREEEWFKVFIHESMHNFGLDFARQDGTPQLNEVHQNILSLFHVNSEVNLFEAYTEFWAEMMNICFCSFYISSTVKEYLFNCESMINIEINFGFFQMVKILKFMNITYTDIIQNTNNVKEKYKETTNILSYYVIQMILFYFFQDFLKWCTTNNSPNFIQFHPDNLGKFFTFIQSKYQNKKLLDLISYYEKMPKIIDHPILNKTLMMSICNYE